MDVLRSIRRGSAVVFTCGWLAGIATAVAGAFATESHTLGHVLIAEILCVAVAATATLVYVVASLTAHIDDTQWAIGYSDRVIRQTRRQPPAEGKDAAEQGADSSAHGLTCGY